MPQHLFETPLASHLGLESLKEPPDHPKMSPKVAPRWPKMAPRRPKMARRWPKMVAKWPQDGPRLPKMAPRSPQEPPQMAQDGPKEVLRLLEVARRWPTFPDMCDVGFFAGLYIAGGGQKKAFSGCRGSARSSSMKPEALKITNEKTGGRLTSRLTQFSFALFIVHQTRFTYIKRHYRRSKAIYIYVARTTHLNKIAQGTPKMAQWGGLPLRS